MGEWSLWGWLVAAVTAITGSGQGADVATAVSDPAKRPAYLDSIKAPPTIKAGETLQVMIEGNLPDPSWELADLEVHKSAGKVSLTPWIRRTHNKPVMQMLVPFERAVPVEGLAAGAWTIEVRGHGDQLERVQVEVTP